MKEVRLYTIDNCPYCTELKESLKYLNIPYTDINVNLPEHEAEFEKLMEKTKSDDVPIAVVGKDILAPNVSFRSIKQLANIITDLRS